MMFVGCNLYSQTNKGIITLSGFNLELNGEKIEIDTIITAKLVPNSLTTILIYNSQIVDYYVDFTYKFKGRRAKLVKRTYAQLPDGKRVNSKKKKDMQELKVSVPGFFKGKCAESILYNKRSMGSIFVSFNYEYTYMAK